MRDETLPRVSALKAFIDQEEFDSIPPNTLEAASERGTEKHDLLEHGYGKESENPYVNMFNKGLLQVIPNTFNMDPPTIEEQLNGKRFTGKPDFRQEKILIDYKFSNDLRPTTALQDILYAKLEKEINGVDIEDHYAFHFPKDHGLFIYRIPETTIAPLHDYADYIIDQHEAIADGELERYEAIIRWEKLLQDHDVLEPVGQVLPPLTITCEADAVKAAVTYYRLKQVLDYEAKMKRELKRYFDLSGDTSIEDINGYGVKLETRNNKVYDPIKKAAAKAIYDTALAKCLTGTKPSLALKRFAPKAKKPKQIN